MYLHHKTYTHKCKKKHLNEKKNDIKTTTVNSESGSGQQRRQLTFSLKFSPFLSQISSSL